MVHKLAGIVAVGVSALFMCILFAAAMVAFVYWCEFPPTAVFPTALAAFVLAAMVACLARRIMRATKGPAGLPRKTRVRD